MARIEIDARHLHELLPIITQFCRVTGSSTSQHPDTVMLVIEGPPVRDFDLVTCVITKIVDGDGGELKALFVPVHEPEGEMITIKQFVHDELARLARERPQDAC